MNTESPIPLFPTLKSFRNPALLKVLVLALLIRLIWFFAISIHDSAGFFMVDSQGYLMLAKNTIEYGSYSMSTESPLYPDVFRTPVFPLLLMVFYSTKLPIELLLLIQIIASVLVVFYTYELCRVLFGQKFAIIPALIVAVDIPSIVFANSVMTESLFSFFILLAGVLLVKHFFEKKFKYLIWAAIVFVIASLTRPISIGLPLFLIPVIWFGYKKYFTKNSLKPILIFILIYYSGISIWIVRNYVYHEKAFISYIGSFNLIYFSASELISKEKNTSINESRTYLYEEGAKLMQDLPNEKPAIFYSKTRSVALREIAKRPIAFIKMALFSEFKMLFHPMSGYIHQQFYPDWNFPKKEPLWFNLILYFQYLQILIYSVLSALGLIQLLKKKYRFQFIFILGIIGYFLCCSFGPEMEARFRIPIIPFIALISMAGMQFIKEKRLKNALKNSDNG